MGNLSVVLDIAANNFFSTISLILDLTWWGSDSSYIHVGESASFITASFIFLKDSSSKYLQISTRNTTIGTIVVLK